MTQRNWLIRPAATKKCSEQNVVVSRTCDDAVGKLVFNGNWEVRLGKMSGAALSVEIEWCILGCLRDCNDSLRE